MILLTITPIPGGYRLIAATPNDATGYRWHIYRNHQRIDPATWVSWPNNVIAADLPHPVTPGAYWVRVDRFRFPFHNFFSHPQAQYSSLPVLLPFT